MVCACGKEAGMFSRSLPQVVPYSNFVPASPQKGRRGKKPIVKSFSFTEVWEKLETIGGNLNE